MKILTATEIKAIVERRCATSKMSKDFAYYVNESHINARAYAYEDFIAAGRCNEKAATALRNHVAALKNKFL